MEKILSLLQNWLKGVSKSNNGESEANKTIKAVMKAVYWILAALGIGQVFLWIKEGSSDDDEDNRHHRNEHNRSGSNRSSHFNGNRGHRRN